MLSLIKPGDTHRGVAVLQRALNLKVDANFGPMTEAAVREYQRQQKLGVDGIVGPLTIARLKLDLTPTKMKPEDLEYAARRLGWTLPMVKAFYQVESGGKGFRPDGNPAILYERHYFWRLCVIPRKPGQTEGALVAARAAFNKRDPEVCNPKRFTLTKTAPRADRYLGGAAEYDRLDRVRAFSDTAGLMSCSWGLFQIMGEYAQDMGYADVQAYVRAMQASETDHVEAFCRFILKIKPKCHAAVKAKNWLVAAQQYNGMGQKGYDVKLKQAYIRNGGT